MTTGTLGAAYTDEIARWRQKMDDGLRADDGWLTLVGLSLWLARTNRGLVLRTAVGVPMLFMMSMTVTALWLQIVRAANAPLAVFGVLVLALAAWITAEAAWALWRHRPASATAPATERS